MYELADKTFCLLSDNLGEDCPVFDNLFEFCQIYAGGTIGSLRTLFFLTVNLGMLCFVLMIELISDRCCP